MNVKNRRSFPRVPISMDVMIGNGDSFIKTDEMHTRGKLLDLSIAGACLELQRSIPIDHTIMVSMDFRHLFPNAELLLPAMIVWNHKQNGHYRHGLLFTYIEDEDLSKLEHIVHTLSVT